ncbi:MAG: tetratricopeptide repeat protein [Smithellaceae bacterium]
MRSNRLFVILFAAIMAIVFITAANKNVHAAFFSKSSTDYYKEGLSHFQKKNYYLSIQSIEKALQLKSDYPAAQRILGFNYIKTGRAADAEYIFTEQYKNDSTNTEVIQGLAWSKYILGKYSESEKYFRDEFKWAENHITNINFSWYAGADQAYIESIYSDANFGLAFLAKAQKNYLLAVKYFEAAAKYPNDFTNNTDILTAYGDLYYEQAKYPEAIAIYERAVKKDKNNLSAQLKIAWSYYYAKDFPNAEKAFEKALAISNKQESVESLYGIALSNYMQNKFDKAYGNFAKAIAVNPYYTDNAVVQGIIEKKPEWKTLWKDFGLAYTASNYSAAIYKLDGYLQKIKADDVQALLAEGWSYRGLGYLDKATEIFNAVLKLNPKADEAYAGLGFTYLSYNKPADALKAFNQALSMNPESAIAYNGLAYYYLAQKDEAKALDSVQKSVSLKSDYYDSQAFIANLFFKQKKYDQAIKEYDKLIQIDKSIVSSWNMSGWAYYYAGKYENALKVFAESKKINPFMVEAHYGLGLCFAKTDDMDEAKDELAAAIAIYPYYAHTQDLINLIKANPKWSDLYKTLGWSYYNYQQYKLSAAAFKEYLASKPGDIEALRGLAWSNYWLGQLDESYAGFKEILNNKAKDTDALVGLGWVLYIRGKDSEALSYLEKAVNIDDKIVNAWRTIAAINFRAKNFVAANNIYNKIAALQPFAVDAYNNQGWALYKESKYTDAIAKFNESLRVNKYLGEPYYGLAMCYVKAGNIDKAKENFATALYLYPAYMDGQELYNIFDSNPKLKELYSNLGWSYYYQYYYDKAKSHFQKILKADTKNRDALLGIGTISYVLGDWSSAIESYNKLLPGISSTATAWDKYSYMLDNLGWSYYYQKKYDKALETFKRLENYHPNISYIAPMNGEGWCELMKGNKAAAQKLFQKSLKIVPYNYSAEMGIKEINK